MANDLPPHLVAQGDQFRAGAAVIVEQFVDQWRRMLADGSDANYAFATLYEATLVSLVTCGPETIATVVTTAIEQLAAARGDL